MKKKKKKKTAKIFNKKYKINDKINIKQINYI